MTEYLTAAECRRANLATLVSEAGGQVAVAAKLEVTPAQVSQWAKGAPDSKSKKPRSISDESARRIEALFLKPRGWMDQDHKTAVGMSPDAPPLTTAIDVVLAALAGLPGARWASVRAQLDQFVDRPDLRPQTTAELRQLLQAPASTPGMLDYMRREVDRLHGKRQRTA